ncbi:hypothetical protein ACM7G7_03895 [Pseudomonas aeruginosa]
MTTSKIQMDQIRPTSATVTGENIRAGSQKKSSLSPAEGLQGASPDATCTCPSGDGSLRHPCPAHPAVEQAGGDERAAFEKIHAVPRGIMWNEEKSQYVRVHEKHCSLSTWNSFVALWAGWMASAALTQPSPAQAEKAEVERPEVAEVAFVLRNIGAMDAEDIDGDNVDLRFEDAEGRDTGCDVSIVEYAEKAADLFEQHDRIVGALRAENAKLSEALDRWPLIRDILKLRLADAQARVAALTATRNRYGVDAHYFNKNLQRILRDFESFTPDELARSLIILAKVADEKVVAQAQHSVPDGFREKFKQCMELAFAEIAYYVSPEKARDPNSRARKAGALATELHAMLAAAPGTEVPQAWLDVQAERRRQIEAEGWTQENDDAHSHGQMARAAACYALAGSSAPNDGTAALLVSLAWPWDEQWWKPSTARRDMVKACALALAEIERLDRAAAPGKEGV